MHCFTEGLGHRRPGRWTSASTSRSPASSPSRAQTSCARWRGACPDDRLLVETDSPYLAPVPHRGKPNEPRHVVHVAALLAELRCTDVETIAAVTTANFARLFGVPLAA